MVHFDYFRTPSCTCGPDCVWPPTNGRFNKCSEPSSDSASRSSMHNGSAVVQMEAESDALNPASQRSAIERRSGESKRKSVGIRRKHDCSINTVALSVTLSVLADFSQMFHQFDLAIE